MANNGKTSSSLSNKILDAFEILAQAEVNSAQFDKTITGIIVSCEDEATGRYKVQYQDAIFYAYSTALDVTYSKGTSVQVKIPNNDFSGRKMIIGTVEENGIDYGTIVEDPLLRYEYIGIDCINSTEQNDLSSYWDEEKNNIILYDIEKGVDLIELNEQMVADNLKQGDAVLLGATFRTSIPDVQRFKGDYGIKYTLTFNDKANVEATVDRYYIVDIDKMSGDPYAYEEAVDQIIPFDIDSENFCYVKKIELFAKNFIYQDNTKPADIFISNLRFQVANRISDEEFMGTALTVLTPEGNYFSDVEGLISKRAIAELRIKGKITDNTTKQIQYYWFIEDLRINKSSDVGYHKFGGRGWKCLNDYTVTEGEEENPISVEYVSAQNTYYIQRDASKAKETKYKCVIDYKGQILSKEFYFIDYDVTDEVYIIADRNPNFIDSIGATTLTCVATEGVSYQWARIDIEGGFEALKDTTADNDKYESAVKEYNELIKDIEEKREPDNAANQNILKFHLDTIESFQYKERRKENQIINLQAGSIYHSATYKCQAFDKDGNSLGIASQLVTNYSSSEENPQAGTLVINNGAQIFKYDAKGIAPTSTQFDNPQTILPLDFTLRNAQGIEVPMKALRDEDVTWIVPIKDTMIKDYFGSFVSRDEESGFEVYNGKSLSYNINENYYAKKDNNEIELRVKYQDLVYVAKTNFIFTKDGDNGTNGTDYVLKIIPNDTIGRLKTIKASEPTGNWFRIQLWYNGIKIYEDNKSGIASTNKSVKLTWEMLGEQKNTVHNINVTSNDKVAPTWSAARTYDTNAIDIVKAIVDYDDMRIVATAPVIYSQNWINSDYKVSLKENTGFTHVVYSEDGLTPDYDSHTPFELVIHKKFGDTWGDITGHSSLTYEWRTIGNLKIKKGYAAVDENDKELDYSNLSKVMFEPVGKYNSEPVNNTIVCTIKEDNITTIGTFYIPVHFLLNTYGHSALNSWDGNSISLDADGGTMLLAPQAGFGTKDTQNRYTGVMLGTVKDYTKNTVDEYTGMFGYNQGTRTMFLNSENGSAVFGSVGSAQIIIDPTQDQARLYSNDFYKTYDTKTGLPINYDPGNENTGHDANNPSAGKGALINLTKPEIRWGNQNFMVDENGFLTAQGGGKIAGWKINDYRIDSIDNGTASNKTGKTGMSSVYTAGAAGVTQWDVRVPKSINANGAVNKPIAFWAGGTGTNGKFHVAHDGFVRMQEASIGSGSTNNLIYIGKSGDNSAIHTFNKPTFNTNANGFYIGVDGISLGSFNSNGESKFQVTNQGVLTTREGTIGGWTITRNTIAAGNIILNANGSMSGGNSSGGTWSIAQNGTATFNKLIAKSSGEIAGWTISANYLRGKPATTNGTDYIQINSNGSITSPKWTLNRDGTATFTKIRITAAGDSNSASATLMNINSKFIVKGDGSITATSGKIGGWTLGSSSITAGNIKLNSEGSMSGGTGSKTWSIQKDGTATFNSITVNGTVNATGGTFKNCVISGDCTIGGERVDGAFVKNANIAANAISSGQIQNAAITSAKIAAAAITEAKIADAAITNAKIKSLSASKITTGTMSANRISGGTISGVKIDGVTISGGQIGGSSIDAISVGADVIGVNTIYGNYSIGSRTGKSLTQWFMTGWGSIGYSGSIFGTGKLTISIPIQGRTLQFTGGILTSTGSTNSATMTLYI